jgi:hypothetical protein
VSFIHFPGVEILLIVLAGPGLINTRFFLT